MNRLSYRTLTVLLTLLLAGSASADSRVIGTWLTEPGDGLVRIEATDTSIRGIIAGAPPGTRSDPDAKDVNNPDPALRDQPLIGLTILGDYTAQKKRWVDGWIYDPDNGKRYKSRLRLKDANTLEVRGYIGTPMLGRSQIWTRWQQGE